MSIEPVADADTGGDSGAENNPPDMGNTDTGSDSGTENGNSEDDLPNIPPPSILPPGDNDRPSFLEPLWEPDTLPAEMGKVS